MSPDLIYRLYAESYEQINAFCQGIDHAESILPPAEGGNPIHWLLGHIVVSRCNFLMMLDQPSIWDWATCAYFIPGSSPSAAAAETIQFEKLVADLDRTEEQLRHALLSPAQPDLESLVQDKTIMEHLASYATHEAFHAGQLALLVKRRE